MLQIFALAECRARKSDSSIRSHEDGILDGNFQENGSMELNDVINSYYNVAYPHSVNSARNVICVSA